MIKSLNKNLIVGLEIGTNKVVALVGEKTQDQKVNIIGIGNCASKGIYKGRINDLESIVLCIQNVLKQLEKMSKCQISSVYLSLSGKHINYQNENGMIILSKQEVTHEDIEKVVHTAKSIKMSDERRILHVIPQEYSVDQQKKIKNPIGLSGIRMSADVHIITCNDDIAKNIIKAVEICGVKVDQLIFSGLASSFAVLNKEDIESGVCLVDIGGSTMDIMIYVEGSLQYTKVIPYAGNSVTNDISYAFSTSLNEAELIKIKYGCMYIINKKENIEIASNNKKNIKVLKSQMLFEVIEPRYRELLNLINNEILNAQKILKMKGSNFYLSAGIVLTGGGSQILGLSDYAQNIFNNQVRIGQPIYAKGVVNNIIYPSYSTVIGLLYYNKTFYLDNEYNNEKKNFFSKWFNIINNWFKKEF